MTPDQLRARLRRIAAEAHAPPVVYGEEIMGELEKPPTPAAVLGFVPGTSNRLVEWPALVGYYRRLADASPRVELRELGRTTNGNPFVALIIMDGWGHREEEEGNAVALADTPFFDRL